MIDMIEMNAVIFADQVQQALRGVTDPEVGLNLLEQDAVSAIVVVGTTVVITLLATHQPTRAIIDNVRARIAALAGVENVTIELRQNP